MGRNPRSVSIPRDWTRDYLTQWWPSAEPTGSGRQGRDVLGTPGVAFEVKTGGDANFRPGAWLRQARKNAGEDIPVVAWFPPGVGAGSPMNVVAMLPMPYLMRLLELAEVAPPRREDVA